MDPTITAAWIGVGGALAGVGIGAWITNRAAVKSLDKAAAQAEAAQQKEWAEARQRADEEQAEQRRAVGRELRTRRGDHITCSGHVHGCGSIHLATQLRQPSQGRP
jgi:hypothetical protein